MRSESDPAESEAEDESVYLHQSAPPEVIVAFHEVARLQGAVVGRETSVDSFTESLVGEAIAGLGSPDAEIRPLRRPGPRRGARERALEQRSNRRHVLGAVTPTASTRAMREALALLAKYEDSKRRLSRLEAALEESGQRSRLEELRALWEILQALSRMQDDVEMRLAELLAEQEGRGARRALGFDSLEQYAAERLGWRRTTARTRVALVRGLRGLDEVRSAYEEGRLGLEAAQWVARALRGKPASQEVQRQWVAHAEEMTVKGLRDETRILRRARLLGRVDRAVAAVAKSGCSQRASSCVQGAEGAGGGQGALGDGRCAQAGRSQGDAIPAIPDEATWQRSLQRVPGQTRTEVMALGFRVVERLARGLPALEMHFGLRLSRQRAEDLVACMKRARGALAELVPRMAELQAAQEARLPPSARLACIYAAQSRQIPTWVGLLYLLEDFAITHDDPRATPWRPTNATFNRDDWRCMAPGCTSRAQLEEHHICYRSEQGGEEATNKLSLCRFHHQQGEHGIYARCRGKAPLGLVWRLGRRGLGTWFRNERKLKPEEVAALEAGEGSLRQEATEKPTDTPRE
jgi:hypothetical protein